jgi:hypothetical protein
MDIQEFNPTVAELNKIAERARQVDVTDLVAVKEMRLELRTVRTTITKRGKELRDDALKFQKAVIAKEKELLELVTPEEDRLKEIEDIAAHAEEMAEREKKMPWRKEQIMLIGDGLDNPTDAELMDMDDEQFAQHLNARKVAKFDADEAEKREKELEAQREREKEEAVEKAREEEQKKAEQRIQEEKDRADKVEKEAKEKEERAEREAKEKAEREEKEREAAEAAEKAESEKLEKQKKYKTWLSDNNFNEETDKIIKTDGEVSIYRFVSSFKI